ncbi:MAG: M48 family metallopeptidase [Saprospiraceae bacterium]
MKLCTTIILLFLCQITIAQYQPIKPSGEIPADFITASYEKYEQEKENIDRKAKRRTRKNQKEFILESNFGIDDLLKSGLVMFNDPVTNYVNGIVDVLLQDDPELKKELRFYVIRTPSVNAFATNQGIIFINMGLIAHLENEAQLAFILAHEISHFTEKHALEFFLEKKTLDRQNNKGLFKNKKFDNRLAKNNFSKEQESEADELGLTLFLKSNYDLDAVNGAFDVLQFSYLPFGEIPFNKSYFEDEYLIFKESYQLDSIKSIILDVDDDDTGSTHPSLPKRRKAAKEILKDQSNLNRQKFILSENQFNDVREKSRYELLEYYLKSYSYYDAIYTAILLQKESPNDLYLKKIIARSLYGLTTFSNADRFKEIFIEEEDVEGEMGSLVYFINKLDKIELNALALRYIYTNKDDFFTDPIYNVLVKDIFQKFIDDHGGKFYKFKNGKAPDLVSLELTEIEKPKEDATEEEKAEYENMKKERDENPRYVYHGFGDFLEDKEVKELIQECEKIKTRKIKRDEDRLKLSAKNRYIKNGDFALGEKKVLVINPFYLKMSKNFEEPLLIKTEKEQEKFTKKLLKNAKRLGLELVILDANNLAKEDVDVFNDLIEIQDWFGHQIEMDEEDMIAHNQERIDAIAKKYDVDAVLWTGVITGKVKKTIMDLYVKLLLLVTVYDWGYNLFVPKGESIIFSLVLDTKSGDRRMSTFDQVKYIDHDDIVNQRIYDILMQVKNE